MIHRRQTACIHEEVDIGFTNLSLHSIVFLDYTSLKAKQIKQQIRIHKEKLLDELEPEAIVLAFSKTNASLKDILDRVRDARSCNTRIHLLLTLVEEGSSDCVEGFLSTLKKLGYSEIVKLIDPESVENRAGKLY